MSWLVFSYSLPSGKSSSVRVALWRRLKRIGAVSPKGSVFILPDRDDCLESFQWLVQEIQQSKGEALVMKVERFEGLSDKQVIEFFHTARRKEYDELLPELEALHKVIKKTSRTAPKWYEAINKLEKLHKCYNEIVEVDFFHSQNTTKAKTLLKDIEAIVQNSTANPPIERLNIADYRNRIWITRPRPFVDRLACAWLIRRFIDDKAVIRYGSAPTPQELSFDMKEAVFGHRGNLCSFEVMAQSFGIKDEAIQAVAEIVHEIDLRDSKYIRPETEGVELVLKGWRQSALPDAELEARGLLFFDGLYAALKPVAKKGA